MTTADPRAMLADALGALGETLRHHRDLGFTELPLTGDYLLDAAEALRVQEKALQGCRKCKLCEGRSTVVFGSGNPRAEFVVIGEGPGARQRRGSESPRHPRADRQAPRPRASVRLGSADPHLPSRIPPAQPGRGVQAHGVGGPPARPTGVRPPPHPVMIADVAFDAP